MPLLSYLFGPKAQEPQEPITVVAVLRPIKNVADLYIVREIFRACPNGVWLNDPEYGQLVQIGALHYRRRIDRTVLVETGSDVAHQMHTMYFRTNNYAALEEELLQTHRFASVEVYVPPTVDYGF